MSFKKGRRNLKLGGDEHADEEDEETIDSTEMTKSDTQKKHTTHRMTQSVSSIKFY
jgi:hypothetical protein